MGMDNYPRTSYQGRPSLRDPKAEAVKGEQTQAQRIAERLAQLRAQK